MTDAAILLAELDRAGFAARAEGDRLIVSPFSALPPGLRARLAAHKPALLSLLRCGVVTPDADDVASWSDPALIDAREYTAAWGRLREAAAAREYGDGCRHPLREFMRLVTADGRNQAVEVCAACRANARGTAYVPHAELGGAAAVAALPVWKDNRAGVGQGGLFSGRGG